VALAGLPLLLFALPVAVAAVAGLAHGIDLAAWSRVDADRLWRPALAVSLSSAVLSTATALVACLFLVTRLHGSAAWQRIGRVLGPMLAMPHTAFALGLAVLLMPAGVLARLLAAPLGWSEPPDWDTVSDPRGLALTLVLVFKELPFLLWNTMALLHRPEVDAAVRGWLDVGTTLGYDRRTVWWRIVWPALAPRLAWPVVAVLAYALTVVDVALIVGPDAPPTLAVLAWEALTHGDPSRRLEGAAMALGLALVLVVLMIAAALLAHAWRRAAARLAASGDWRADRHAWWHRVRWPTAWWHVVKTIYVVVALVLLASSFAAVWTFPALLPQAWSLDTWQPVVGSTRVLATTTWLAAAAASTGVVLVVAWMESTPPWWDRAALPVVLAPLVVPPLLLLDGVMVLAIAARLDGSAVGLWWAHVLMVTPYAFLALAPAWRSFDPRYAHVAGTLGRGRAAFFLHVKVPMLAAPLAAAWAIGVARWPTITTEAVTLASGGQRQPAAAFGVAQALLPACAFALAAWFTRRRARVFAAVRVG
jgi:putative thiamine transport system permease protein